MADLSVTPVATQIKPVPNMSLGDMVNLARGAQAYQQSEQMNPLLLQQQKQVVGTGEIALSLEQQKERERNAITEFLKNPANFQTEGRVDINKLNEQIPRIAPLTGSDWMQKYTTLGTAQTQAVQAAQNLTQTQREIIASRLAVMGRLGVNDPRAYTAELDQLVTENPNNPDLKNLVGAYKTTLQNLPQGANLPQLAISGANSLLNPAQQQEAFAPRAGTISTGAATFPTTTTISPAGEPPVQTVGGTPLVTAQLGPGQREVETGRVDMNNNPIVNVFDANGRFLGQRSGSGTPSAAQLPGGTVPTPLGGAAPPAAPGISFTAPTRFNPPGGGIDVNRDISSRQQSYRNLMEQAAQLRATNPGQARDLEDKARYILQGLNKDYGIQAQQPQGMDTGTVTPVARIPPGETQDTINLANQVRIKALESATQVPMQNFNNNEIIKLADEALTGRGAGTLANLTGGYAVFNAVGLGGGNATALNQLGHYMALQTASLAQSAGLGTDAARNIAAESTGTINWTPDAIKKTARVNRSLATATDLFNQGVQSAFERSKGNPLSARDFQNRWSQTADINAIRLFDAMRNNDPDAFREIVDGAGGPQSPGFNRLKTKVEDIKRIVGIQ